MQTTKFSKVFFASSLGIVAITIALANHTSQQNMVLTSSLLNVIITTILMASSVALLVKYGVRGDFGKAWLCFVVFVGLWFVAERIWMIFELVYQIDPWPSAADLFWLAGYPLYLGFTVFYLRPFRGLISVKLVASVLGIATALACLLVYYTSLQNSALTHYEMLLGLAYPVFDSFLLAPIIIGLVLFVRGQVSFTWSCLLLGMLCFVVADYGFLFFSLDDSYQTGHVIDIPYLWAYLFFLFGVYNYTQIFRPRSQENQFEDQDKLR